MTMAGDETASERADRPPDATASTVAEAGQWVATSIDRSRYHTVVRARTHVIDLDEPAEVGGANGGPTPYEALLGALGACTAMTLRMYADRKGWPLEGAQVRLRSARAHAPDCEQCETAEVGPHRIERRIELEGPLTEEQRARLLLIADRCPVKQTLEHGIQVREESR
jgi:putative redox protein